MSMKSSQKPLISFASSSTDMKSISPISPVEEYINSFNNSREVGIQVKPHTKDVGTQTFSYDNALPFTMIESYEIDDDYVAKKLMQLSNKKK